MLCLGANRQDRVVLLAPQELDYLRRSKYCDTFVAAAPDFFESAPEAAGAMLTEIAARCGATLIVGADSGAVRLLAAAAGYASVPCFPTPPRDVYDTVNNKWTFYRFCVEAVPPRAEHLSDLSSLTTPRSTASLQNSQTGSS